MLVPDLRNPIYGALLAGISGRLERDGYTAIIFETRSEEDRMTKALRVLDERRVEGAINAAARATDRRRLAQFIRKGVPMVLAARDVPGLKVPRVLNDDWKGGALAAEHLLSLGHRRIAQITGPTDVVSFLERAQGFRSTVANAGAALRVHDAEASIGTVEEGRRVMRTVLRRHELPTAIFAHNDLLAIGAMAALREVNLDCPGDVSIVGYNGEPLTEYLDPPLTTVLFPAEQLGHVAAETVLSMLCGTEPRFAVALQPQLIVRQSTAEAPRPKRQTG
ncbi:MAG: LacI family DNA-binding transcriptional regulator [Streptosporangiaceae bacterium]